MHRLAGAVSPERSERAPVRDDEDTLAGMCVRDPLDRRENPGEVLLSSFAVVVLRSWKALRDLCSGEARPRPDIHLPQTGVRDHGHAVRCRNDLGRLVRAPQVARVDGVEPHRRESLGELARLGAAGRVERRVGMSLKAPLTVPVGLPMSRQQDRRRHDGHRSV